MAIVQNPITGRSKNKFANSIFQTNHGDNILRSKPLTVRNPKTGPQKSQRKRFTIVVKVMRVIISTLRFGFKGYQQHMAAFSFALKQNMKTLVTGTYPLLIAQFSNLKISMGDLSNSGGFTFTRPDSSTIHITWDETNMVGYDAATDILCVVAGDSDCNILINNATGVTRSDGNVDFNIHGPLATISNVFCTAFFATSTPSGRSGSELSSTNETSIALHV